MIKHPKNNSCNSIFKYLLFILFLITVIFNYTYAQIDIQYQEPPESIRLIADANPSPLISLDEKGEWAILLFRNKYKGIDEMSGKEMKLGGLRINPKNYTGSRTNYFSFIKLLHVPSKKEHPLRGIPENSKISNIAWSPDEKKVAFIMTDQEGAYLWLLDIASLQARRLCNKRLNATYGSPYVWLPDQSGLLIKALPDPLPVIVEESEIVPSGPTVSVNDGNKAQNRTYQDLLKNKLDEENFENLISAEIWQVTLDGHESLWKENGMYAGINISPDGKLILITEITRPFSYLVPASRFPRNYSIFDTQGSLVLDFFQSPLTEELPKGFMAVPTGPRSINWRSDKPSTLYWIEAMDGGDPEVSTELRDALYQWDAPFDGEKQNLLNTSLRFSSILWGNDELALARSYWWNTRNEKVEKFNPSDFNDQSIVISDRNYQDRYNDPGMPVFEINEFGKNILAIRDNNIFLSGDGWSDDGMHPFIDQYNLFTGEKKRIYQADKNEKLENIIRFLDVDKGLVLSRIESQRDFPNYFIRNIFTGILESITAFPNPIQILQDVHKEILTYKRNDGVELSGTLYLPAGYDRAKGEKMPMIIWAYPREFKDVSTAGQLTASPYQFTFPNYGSPVFWVTRGYVVLDGASFPIVGEGDQEPNDSFIEQLVENAKAAINAVDALGYIDRNKVAVGGHSYGAFMTANLLSHSDIFAAGIARSGAYNRTLTPFGFQQEERSYWEAPQVYNMMSPFMHADKMKTPMLLIHGQDDNNSGTFPMQSERYFNALKGHGATVRLVILPKESHGYAARESIMHMLWEQDQWLEKYVKNRELPTVQTP
ncbi:MAG TPA: prolyl oligopeptidase family serine peptidase [Saprospiraceae bacterium]|nr:prolyl oligopeptidase family serine peptidase [Saprospiraceae bacterium]